MVARPEPDIHRLRQKAILKEFPEVKQLYGRDSRTQYYAYTIIVLQLWLAYVCRSSWSRTFVLATTIGPYLDACVLAFIHEATHMLIFQVPGYNRLISIASNMVMIIPLSEIFKQHHSAHHKNLGDESFDVDVPTEYEIKLVGTSRVRKALWMALNMIILPARSLRRLAVDVDKYLITNWVVCIGFGLLCFVYSRSSFVYLMLSTLQSQGLHPANSRQVQRHIYNGDENMREPGELRPPTYSYYGAMNSLTLNVGLHIEHHDFPCIPWTRLPQLRQIAGSKWYPAFRAHPGRGFFEMMNFILNPKISLADFAH